MSSAKGEPAWWIALFEQPFGGSLPILARKIDELRKAHFTILDIACQYSLVNIDELGKARFTFLDIACRHSLVNLDKLGKPRFTSLDIAGRHSLV